MYNHVFVLNIGSTKLQNIVHINGLLQVKP